MQAITTVGLDIAKSVFQVHGVDAAGKVIIRRQLRRRHVLAFFQRLPACVVGIEACDSIPRLRSLRFIERRRRAAIHLGRPLASAYLGQ